MERSLEPTIHSPTKERSLKTILLMYNHRLIDMQEQLDGLFTDSYAVENLDEIREIAMSLQEIQRKINMPEKELSMELDYDDIPIQTKNKLNTLDKDFMILSNAFLAIGRINREQSA